MQSQPGATGPAGRLGAAERQAAVRDLDGSSVDVLVVGGGITGVGVALDAATRGLDVVLVERSDLASGTSSRSTKLIHGGLRYLEQLDLPLVREALAERGRLVATIAPHLVRPLPFLFPLQRHWQRVYIGAGIALYDSLAVVGGDHLPRHRHLGRAETQSAFRDLRTEHVVGSVRYWDGQVDDARHTVAVARTAAQHGARIITNAEVVGLDRTGGRVTGATVLDRETGIRCRIRAGVVVNATGPWAGRTEQLAETTSLRMRTSKGVHITVPRDRIDGQDALITKTASSVLFVIPHGAVWLIGTTDTPWHQPLEAPATTAVDVEYLLEQTNGLLTSGLDHDDVVGVFSGLRPLVEPVDASGASPTTKISREHLTATPVPGLVSIAGGKYTTYRVMADDAVTLAMAELGRADPGCQTADLAVIGATGLLETERRAGEWATRFGGGDQVERLLGRYGSEIRVLADLIDEQPALADPLVSGTDYLAVEVVHAARAESVRHLEDVLARRTRLAFDSPDRGRCAAPVVADLLAGELGWTAERRDAEVAAFEDRLAAERAAETMSTDADAAARLLRLDEQRATLARL